MSFGFGVGDFLAVAKLAKDVRQRWSDAPGEYAAIRNEVKTLESLLQDLSDLDHSGFPATQKTTLQDVVTQCKDVLGAANRIVDSYSTKPANAVRKTWRRLKADPDDVRHVRDQLVAIITQLNAVQNNIQIELDREILEDVQDLNLKHNEEKLLRIANWFSSPAFAQQQTTQLHLREPGTAMWFIQHSAYQTWRSGLNQTLFCPGIAGSGKSVIFATVVADLQRYVEQNSDTIVAYFYCNYKRKGEQTLPLILAALVRQLFQERALIPQSVEDTYNTHVKRGSRPSVDELQSLFEVLISIYSKVFILVDALDECNSDDEYHTRDNILSYLVRLQTYGRSQNINIMTTSRPGVVNQFDSHPRIEIKAQPEDIERYLKENIVLIVPCTQGRPGLANEIVKEIAGIVDGMFLLARLHLESLHDKTKPRAILKALGNLPRGSKSAALDQAYNEVLVRIDEQPEGFRDLARRTLAWITLARRELTIDEVQEALAIEPGMQDIDRELDLDDKRTIISVCAGLLFTDPESGKVRFAHYTTQVYLESHQTQWHPDAQTYIAQSCFVYLSMHALYANSISWGMNLWSLAQRYKFLHYAGKHWGVHMREVEDSSHYFRSIRNDQKIICLLGQLLFGIYGTSVESYWCYPQSIPLQNVVAYYNDPQALRVILAEERASNSVNSTGQSALHIAAIYGCDSAASVLLAQPDINVNLRDQSGETPLSRAAWLGHTEVIAQLLARQDIGPSVNLQNQSGETPLSRAAREGRTEVVAQLLTRSDIILHATLTRNLDAMSISYRHVSDRQHTKLARPFVSHKST